MICCVVYIPPPIATFALQVIDRAYLSQEQFASSTTGPAPAKPPQPPPAGGVLVSTAAVSAVATASVEICISNATPSALILPSETTITVDSGMLRKDSQP